MRMIIGRLFTGREGAGRQQQKGVKFEEKKMIRYTLKNSS